MKILFVRLDDSSIYEKRSVTVLEPLGLEYVAGNLPDGYVCEFCDLNIGDKFPDKTDADYICITVPTPLYNQAKTLIRKIRTVSNARVIVGGPHPSCLPDECITDLGADTAIVGEGEQLADYINTNGVVFAERIKNLDDIKFPLRINRNYALALGGGNRAASMITSRSCPYRCVFCSSKKIFGHKVRLRSVDNVMAEIAQVYESGIRTIIFLDDTFTLVRDRVMNLCLKIIESGMKIVWWVDTRVDKVDYEMLCVMKAAGCAMIVFGIESGNNDVLRQIGKDITTDEVRKAISETKRAGISCKANFMLGHYNESVYQMYDTISFAEKLKATTTSFYQVIPLPGTSLFEYAGIKTTDEYDRLKWYGDNIPVICEKHIDSTMLKRLQTEAYERIARC